MSGAMMAKTTKRKPPKVNDTEKEQVRARRIVGHDFALRTDEYGRSRLISGTAESSRQYEIASAGTAVRVRRIDPLKGVSSLTDAQRQAGEKYRETFEFCQGQGASAIQLQVRVDGGKKASGLPEELSIAHASLAAARKAIGHHEIVRVVTDMCVSGLTASDIAAKTGDPRHAISKLLRIGLDNLAVHYRIVPHPK